MELEIKQILTQSVGFLIMLWILSKFAWKPLLKLLEDRQNEIKSQFDTIDREKEAVHQQKIEYQRLINTIDEQAKLRALEAIHEAHRVARAIKEDALHKAKSILQRTHQDRDRELAKAKVIIKDEIINLALSATQKLLKANLDEEKQKKLVVEFMEKAE